MSDEDIVVRRDETVVAADAVWALVEAGLVARTPDAVKAAATAAGLSVDALRVASLRTHYARPPTEGALVRSVAQHREPAGPGSGRSFAHRLREAVDRDPKMPHEVIATRMLDDLTPHQRGDLLAWLESQAPDMIAREAKAMKSAYANRGVTRSKSVVVSFAHQAAKFELGQLSALADFKAVYSVNGQPKELGLMTGADHDAVAHGFESLGKTSAFMAAIHRQVALQVGDKTTGEVFTPDTYRRLLSQPKALDTAS